MTILTLETLSKEAFAPFGDVIQTEGSEWFPINNGTTRRYHDLARVRFAGDDGHAAISLALGDPFHYPIVISMLERHPLGSQSWIPCNKAPFIVVVAPNAQDDRPDESAIRAFYASGSQGVNYFPGTWHHPLLTLEQRGEFVVVDRIGTAANCDECELSRSYRIDATSR